MDMVVRERDRIGDLGRHRVDPYGDPGLVEWDMNSL
jgi:hypothetical protein